MAQECSLTTNNSILQQVEKLVSNPSIARNIATQFIKHGEFTTEFKRWLNETLDKKVAFDVNTTDKKVIEEIAKGLVDYYYHANSSVNYTTTSVAVKQAKDHYGYTDDFARREGITHVATTLLSIYNDVKNKQVEIKGDKLKYYTLRLRDNWLDYLFNTISDERNISLKQVRDDYAAAQDKTQWLDNMLGGDKKSVQNANKFAVYQELFLLGADTSTLGKRIEFNSFMKEVLSTGIMESLRKELYSSVEEDLADAIAEASAIDEADTSADNGEVEKADMFEGDYSIMQYNSHGGMYSSFLKHVGARIANYFNTLRKLTVPNDLKSYNTENSYGIPDCMDAVACSTMIYSSVNCNSIQSMLADIERIAKQVSGFEAFSQLAHDLRNDLDFATEFRTVFNKVKMNKTEVVIEQGKVQVRSSNPNVDSRHVMINQLFSDLQSTLVSSNIQNINKRIINLQDINNKRPTGEALEKTISDTINICREFCPSLQSEAIRAFINTNGKVEDNDLHKYANIKKLLALFTSINNRSNVTKSNYNAMLYAIEEARDINKRIAIAERKGDFSQSSKRVNVLDIYNESFLGTTHNQNILGIVNLLLNYSIISIDLNSRNAYGNNSSDIINNSHIGNLYNMLGLFRKENEVLKNDALVAWCKDKLRAVRYKHSNVLLEHRNSAGDIINYGLVYWNGDDYVLTDYADKLLAVSLFNGSSDRDSESNVGYSKMTEGDYLPTSFMQTMNTELADYEKTDTPFDVGTYFLRTPSDAPKNYTLRMPKYDTRGLLTIADQEAVQQTKFDIVQNYAKVYPLNDQLKAWLDAKHPKGSKWINEMDRNELSDYLFPKPDKDFVIKDYTDTMWVNQEKQIIQMFVHHPDGRILVLEGTHAVRGKSGFLTNATFKGIIGYNTETGKTFDKILPYNRNNPVDIHTDTQLFEAIAEPFIDRLHNEDVTLNDKTYNKFELVLNRSHPVYEILYNIFKQELVNAANAAHVLFKFTDQGDIDIEDADGVLKPKFNDGFEQGSGYNFYHKDGKKTYEKKGGGVNLLGKVFHSSKFAFGRIVKDSDGARKVDSRNYLEELISSEIFDEDKGKINILYGRQSGTHMGIKFDSNGEVEDVILTAEQERAIADKLKEFVENYSAYVEEALREKSDYITGVGVNVESARDYAINQFIAHNVFDDLFDGDTKYYKDGRTILKRTKQNQGSGVGYGISDITKQNRKIEDINDGSSFLNSGEITEPVLDEKGKPILDDDGKEKQETKKVKDILSDLGLNITQRTGWHAVTVANSKNGRNATFDLLVKTLVNAGLSENRAMDLIYGPIKRDKKTGEPIRENPNDPNSDFKREGGFTDTKVNDAQSYITYEEFVRRIAAKGQLQRYLPLLRKIAAFNRNDKSTYLTASEITQFVQVQKNFYYDQIYDDRYKDFVPRQIKNAEFVLIPQFIEGTQLENVYNIMKRLGIDQLNTVETSKAANEKILNLWDNNGDITDEQYETFEKEAKELLDTADAACSYWYNNLYTQQESPQHMNETNKAGIQFLKKIVDNVPQFELDANGKQVKTKVQELKEEFFEVYTANIEQSLNKLLSDLRIPRDKNGRIILDEEGKIQGLDEKQLYDKLLQEFMRTGLDRNMLAFCEIDEITGKPRLSPIMNNIISKFESVVQSVFNHAITRQELPGFHAAQVTNVGFKTIREQAYDNGTASPYVTYDKKLKYHVDDKGNYSPYIEIMVPLSWLGINVKRSYYKKFFNENGELDKEALLKELDAKGLTTLIGYRIPTEGKQSMCNMKVVGLLDDSQGSTIIVPDEWVAQTGSDFDIDSVYTMQFNTRTKRNGEINKIEYISDNSKLTEFDYFNYLKRESEDKNLDTNYTKEVYQIIADKRKELIEKLPQAVKAKINQVISSLNGSAESLGYSGTDAQLYKIGILNSFLETQITKFKNSGNASHAQVAKMLEDVVAINDDVVAYIHNDKNGYSDFIKDSIAEAIQQKLGQLEQFAESQNLFSFEEFRDKKNLNAIQSKAARDNRIVEIAQKILEDKSSLEENLSRSNFDDIVKARNEAMSQIEKDYRASYSPYDVIAQVKYQDDAMSGADLKALSVTLDTFCSVCNTVRPTLERPIKVLYNTTETITIDNALKAYNPSDIKSVGDRFVVTHNTYGWTKNNKNIVGKILTAYSSQTTALILDAIKEGNIPNVNLYSFGAFKTLVNAGVPYEAAIPFIMQPAISTIMEYQKGLNSVFGSGFGNPIVLAIRDIATKLDLLNRAEKLGIEIEHDSVDNMPVNAIMDMIDDVFGDDFNRIFMFPGKEANISIAGNKYGNIDIPIDVARINERINDNGTDSVDRLLFDLGNILLYNKLHNTASSISEIARVSNPDKFGAKQTVYATREIFEAIDDILYEKEAITNIDEIEEKDKYNFVKGKDGNIKLAKKARKPILTAANRNGQTLSILECIYPGCNVAEGDIDDIIKGILQEENTQSSTYPSLYAMLRCASITSVAVAKEVFDTQRPGFVQLCKGLSSVFSDNKLRIDETTYNDFQKYVIGTLYNQIGVIRRPIQIDKVGNKLDYKIDDSVSDEAETRRIYGVGYAPTLNVFENNQLLPVEVNDIYNPTSEEMRLFEKFSPAQKVQWIKTHFVNPGIFAYLNVSLYNESSKAGKRQGMHSITFVDQNVNQNDILDLFAQAFNNSNPLIVSTCIDLIKYAAKVEGFRMTKNGVMKVIDNETLINDLGDGGTGFGTMFQEALNNLNNGQSYSFLEDRIELYENYLRSHPNCKGIRTVKIWNKKARELGLPSPDRGMYIINMRQDQNTQYANRRKFEQNLIQLGIGYSSGFTERFKINKYVRLIRNNQNILYKIIDFGDTIILTPLGNLQSNETGNESVRPENNEGFLSKEAYAYIVEEYRQARYVRNETIQGTDTFINIQVAKLKREGNIPVEYIAPPVFNTENIPAIEFSLEQIANEQGGVWSSLLNNLQAHFSNPNQKSAYYSYLQNLGQYVLSRGGRSRQKIQLPDGREVAIYIAKKDLNRNQKGHYTGSFAEFYLKHPDREIPDNLPTSLQEILSTAQSIVADRVKRDSKFNPKLEPVYEIGIDEEASYAMTEGTYEDIIDFATAMARGQQDESSKELLRSLNSNGIENTKESIEEHLTLVDRQCVNYATNLRNEIHNMFHKFAEDTLFPDSYDNALSDRAKLLIRNNRAFEEKAMRLVEMARSFLDRFGIYDSLTTEDEEKQPFINMMREALQDVRNLPIEELSRVIQEVLIDRTSRNPLIKDGLIDTFDGFWKNYGSMWQFHDIAENGTPILQVTMKEIMGDIDAQRMMQIKAEQEYWKTIDKIKKDAKRKGLSIDIQKIVDRGGRFVQDYTPEFVDKLEELQSNLNTAIDQHGRGSIQHLTAKLQLDEFYAKYINQEADPEYYFRKNALLRYLLESNPRLAEAYHKALYERNALYGEIIDDTITPDLARRLYEANLKLKQFTAEGVYYGGNGEYVRRPSLPEDIITGRMTRERYYSLSDNEALYSDWAQHTISGYVKQLEELNDEYFERAPIFGFDQELADNLKIIRDAEQRLPNGLPSVPLSQLEKNKEYQKAKKWIRKNAIYSINIEDNELVNQFRQEVNNAIIKLKLDRGLRPKKVNKLLWEWGKQKLIRDEAYVVDGTQLTDEERAQLKAAQDAYYKNDVIPPTSDRQLISNVKPKGELYNHLFWDKFKTGGAPNREYYDTVTEINKILTKYYDNISGRVLFSRIPRTKRGIEEIRKLGELYHKLRQLKKTTEEAPNTDWIKQNTKTVTDTESFELTRRAILDLAQGNKEWAEALIGDKEHPGILFEVNKDGNIVYKKGKVVPNRFLFSYTVLNEKIITGFTTDASGNRIAVYGDENERNKYLAQATEEDMQLINEVYKKTPTKYWYQALGQAAKTREENEKIVGKEEADRIYNEWLENQYVFNPFSREKELLPCWTQTEFNTDVLDSKILDVESETDSEGNTSTRLLTAGVWKMTPRATERKVQEGKKNRNYDPDGGRLANFVKGGLNGDTTYDNDKVLNESEKELRDYLKDLLVRSTKNDQGIGFFKKGYLPRAVKEEKTTGLVVLKELGKLSGFGISTKNGEERYYSEIGFDKDKTPLVPMTAKLGNAVSAQYQKDLKEHRKTEPSRDAFATEEEYQEKLKEYKEKEKDLENKIQEIHESLLNRDWLNVIAGYLKEVSRYEAIQSNKTKMFWLLDELKRMRMYERKFGAYGELKQDSRRSTEDNPRYEQSVDEGLIKQYETYLHRMLYDQWKEQEGKLTRFANTLQSFTSANYMTMNIKGGIANVTLGVTGMLSEAAAKEYFGRKEWGFATKTWSRAVTSFARRAYNESFGGSDRCFSTEDAIIQFFNVVDYDEHRGVVRDVSLKKVSEGLRNFTYSPQTMGEHFMQNSVLFAMLRSHKLVSMADGETTYMNETEYLRYKQNEILQDILTEEQLNSLREFKNKIKSNKNELKDYAWFRKDALTEWIILHCDKKQQREFAKKRDEAEKKHREEFKKLQDLYSQCKLGSDGHLEFVPGTTLARLDEQFKEGSNVTIARSICGNFAERVRKTNNKIHGVYNRDGAAHIEKKWYGSLLMQYHKHLPIGLLKRYKARGFFNETRGSIEKGMLQSLIDFISLDFRNVKAQENLTDENIGALQGLQLMGIRALKVGFNMIKTLTGIDRTTWHLLPQYERANIKRNLGDLVGTAAAFAALVGLWGLAGADKDLEDNWAWNMAIYEFDRLCTEAFMYNPWGMYAEGKKLMSTPISAQSIVGDAMSTIGEMAKWIMSDDYSYEYQSGRFAGQNRLLVYLQRRIPIYSSLHGMFDLVDSNHYYKIANSYSTIFGNPKKWAGVQD